MHSNLIPARVRNQVFSLQLLCKKTIPLHAVQICEEQADLIVLMENELENLKNCKNMMSCFPASPMHASAYPSEDQNRDEKSADPSPSPSRRLSFELAEEEVLLDDDHAKVPPPSDSLSAAKTPFFEKKEPHPAESTKQEASNTMMNCTTMIGVEEVMDYRTFCCAIAKTYCCAIAISR